MEPQEVKMYKGAHTINNYKPYVTFSLFIIHFPLLSLFLTFVWFCLGSLFSWNIPFHRTEVRNASCASWNTKWGAWYLKLLIVTMNSDSNCVFRTLNPFKRQMAKADKNSGYIVHL